MIHACVEAEDRQAWLQEREVQWDFVPNRIVVGTVRHCFLDDVLAHHESTRNRYPIPAGQLDAMMACLTPPACEECGGP